MQITHETIYKSLYIQARGSLKKELIKHIKFMRAFRQSGHENSKSKAKVGIIDAVSIHHGPIEVNDRTIPGHWESDLFYGAYRSSIVTLVERFSRYVILVKLAKKDISSVVGAGLTLFQQTLN